MSIKLSDEKLDISILDKTEIVVKKKKGRPRKNPVDITVVIDKNVPIEKKKRGRRKKEKVEVEEEVKPKRKRGRKAAIKYFSSSIRNKIPLSSVIYDNDNYLLHLDIKENEITTSDITYNSINNKTDYSTCINSKRFDSSDDDDNYILNNVSNKNLDENLDEKLDDILGNSIDNDNANIEAQITNLYEKRLESRLLQDEELIKKLENLNNDDNLLQLISNSNKKHDKKDTEGVLENKNKTFLENNKNKGYLNILTEFIHTDKWQDHTDIACWWCCHKFHTIPIGLPVDYYKNKFRTKGIFCTFACSIAYSKSNKYYNNRTKSMITTLYKKLTGYMCNDMKDDYKNLLILQCKTKNLFSNDLELQNEYIESLLEFVETPLEAAPDKSLLKMFGGELSIEQFRNSTKEKKVFKMIEYPMFISRDYVEEIDINNLKKVNKTVFTKQHVQTNNLDDKKLIDVKSRIISNTVTNNGMDKFIKW
jgi:hypothetical protein